eukprot:611924-Prymnesium_polylepis.1
MSVFSAAKWIVSVIPCHSVSIGAGSTSSPHSGCASRCMTGRRWAIYRFRLTQSQRTWVFDRLSVILGESTRKPWIRLA